jgi:hypothetical protein
MTYTENQNTRDYRFDIQAKLDPRALKSLVPGREQRGFEFFEFDEPPETEGFVSGRWRDAARLQFGGRFRSGPFRFRGEPIESFSTRLAYTNGVVVGTEVQLRSEGELNGEGVGFDTRRQLLTLTNIQSAVPPMRVARAIGPAVVRVLSPYRFERPPLAHVDGWLNVRNTKEAGLRFNVAGGPFSYWRFQVPELQGLVVWSNQVVTVDQLKARFYEGELDGRFRVNLSAGSAARFGFDTRVENANLQPLLKDLLFTTNRYEGRLAGSWTVTDAQADDWNSWQGFGQAELVDGYLWDLPLLGLFSDFLGNLGINAARNPVTGLTGDFTMTNSILHTRDLQLRSQAMRLDYRGTFDFQGAMNARVEARLLREIAVIGPLLSLLFSPLTKLLEYRVGGTLSEPKLEPLYVPKPLLFPLNPIGTLKEMFRSRPVPDRPPK